MAYDGGCCGAWLVRGVWGGKKSMESVSTATKPLLFILTTNTTGNSTGRRGKEKVASFAFAAVGNNSTSTSKPVHNCYKCFNEEEVTNCRIIGKKQDSQSELGKAFCKKLESIKIVFKDCGCRELGDGENGAAF